MTRLHGPLYGLSRAMTVPISAHAIWRPLFRLGWGWPGHTGAGRSASGSSGVGVGEAEGFELGDELAQPPQIGEGAL
jgi:hypothetical protein